MIKFQYLIHKETRMIINYEYWLENHKGHYEIKFEGKHFYKVDHINYEPHTIQFKYTPEEMLFSDDFEIIYDSELTTLELIQLYTNSGELRMKLKKIIDQRHYLEREYNTKLW